MQELIDAQLEREQRHSAEATAEHMHKLQEALRAGRLDDIPAANRVVAHLFAEVVQALGPIVNTTARGPGAALRGWLRKVPLDTLAVLSMRVVLTHALRDSMEQPATMQRIAHTLGRAIEQEALVQDAHKANPLYVEHTWDYLKSTGTTSPGHIRKTMQAMVRNVLEGKFDGYLTNAEYIHLGKHGLQACVDAGLVELKRSQQYGKSNAVFRVPEALYEVLAYMPASLSGTAQMMLAPPLPWQGATGGGYYSERMQIDFPLRRVTRRTRKHLRRILRDNVVACTPVIECANYLQQQAFSVHLPSLEMVRRVWEAGGGALGIPRREPPPEPAFPLPEPWDKAQAREDELEMVAAWKRRMHGWHCAKRELRKAQQSIGQALRVTRGAEGRKLWFPTFIDSRGRYYYRGLLNPQGSEISKALLHFADKRPLGAEGLYWLKVHVANCFGFDKAHFTARAAWADERKDTLFAGLDAPEDSDVFRSNKDAPIGAFAAVWEWRQAERSGNPAAYCTGLPVHMDATCSGLQHFSALLRDPVGGRYVNLMDTGDAQKADIYRKVAELAKARALRDAADEGCKSQHLAALWVHWDIPRDVAKGPVMTYVYGATLRGAAEGIADWLDEQQLALPEGVRVFDVAYYMARAIFQAIEDTVPAAASCMRWLRNRAKAVGNEAPLLWHSPTGLLVEHDYRDFDEKRVDIRSCGVSKIVVREELDTTRPARMQNAISPNFVHALDAAHLTFTARRMQARDVAMVAIHDSFGCHPSDVTSMHQCIREAFVELYEEHDPIDLLLRGAGQQAVSPPAKGQLDIRDFLNSPFGFC